MLPMRQSIRCKERDKPITANTEFRTDHVVCESRRDAIPDKHSHVRNPKDVIECRSPTSESGEHNGSLSGIWRLRLQPRTIIEGRIRFCWD